MGKKRPLPAWLVAHAEKCKQAFGLWDWRIDLHFIRGLKRDGSKCLGYHTSTYVILTSDIEYDAGLKNDDIGHDVVTHEFLHVALIEMDQSVRRVMDFVPDKHREHCEALYDTAKEHTVEKLSRHLTPMLRTARPTEEK